MGHTQSTAATATIRETMLQCHMHLCPNCLVVTPCKMGAELNNNTELQHLGLGVSHLSTPQGKRGLTLEIEWYHGTYSEYGCYYHHKGDDASVPYASMPKLLRFYSQMICCKMGAESNNNTHLQLYWVGSGGVGAPKGLVHNLLM